MPIAKCYHPFGAQYSFNLCERLAQPGDEVLNTLWLVLACDQALAHDMITGQTADHPQCFQPRGEELSKLGIRNVVEVRRVCHDHVDRATFEKAQCTCAAEVDASWTLRQSTRNRNELRCRLWFFRGPSISGGLPQLTNSVREASSPRPLDPRIQFHWPLNVTKRADRKEWSQTTPAISIGSHHAVSRQMVAECHGYE
ncbi:hypothetical protein PssiTeo3_49790 [Pseudomonas sichuanensis]|nr:hypothetical protein [Pseudomonas sichuanensis]